MFRKTWEALSGAAIITGSILGFSTAHAADLGGYGGSTKDGAAMARPHVGDWSGIYMGVNAGGVWDEYTSDYRRFADLAVNPDSPKYSSSESSGLIGGHAGIQHQMGRIVVGLEGSWSGKGPFGNDWHGQGCFSAAGGPQYSLPSPAQLADHGRPAPRPRSRQPAALRHRRLGFRSDPQP